MKRNTHFCLLAIMALVPCTIQAQTPVEQIFSRFGESGVTITKTTRQKNPELNNPSETGSLDYYEFKTNRDAEKLVEQVEAAFNASASESYSLRVQNGTESIQKAQVYYNQKQSILVGEYFENYIYMCFADKDHEDFRTIYVFEWNYIGKKKKQLEGRFFKAYSLRPSLFPKYTTISVTGLGDLSLDSAKFDSLSIKLPELLSDSLAHDLTVISRQLTDDLLPLAEKLTPLTILQSKNTFNSSSNWLQAFNIYRSRFLRDPNGSASNVYATKIYELCKNSKSLSDSEKSLVAGEVGKLIGKSKDDFYDSLFYMCIEVLKK